jgi:hypothetical protein
MSGATQHHPKFRMREMQMTIHSDKVLVPRARLELARRYSQPRILSPVRLPISPPGQMEKSKC